MNRRYSIGSGMALGPYILALGAATLSACAGMTTKFGRHIPIDSDPQGAAIFARGESGGRVSSWNYRGTTPIEKDKYGAYIAQKDANKNTFIVNL